MKTFLAVTFVLGAVTALSVTASGARAQTPGAGTNASAPATGNAANGRKLWESYSCYGCHGFNGETGARPLVGSRSQNLAAESNFIAFLRGRANVAPVQPSRACRIIQRRR
jgi:mono/diheme cytochrome c family protein